MTMHCSEKDWLLLSRHLTGALSARQEATLVLRLSSEPELNQALDQLKRIHMLLSGLPEKRIPYNFTIKAGLLPKKYPPLLFPAFRTISVIASLLFAVVFGVKLFAPDFQAAPVLMASTYTESLPAPVQEDPVGLAAPKLSATDDATKGATPATGIAGEESRSLGGQAETQIADEIITVETEYNQTAGGFPWKAVTWVIGLFGLASIALMVLFYFKERL